MKRLLLFLILPLLAVAEELDLPDGQEVDPKIPAIQHLISAQRKYDKEKSVIQAKYRSRLADAMKHADGAEIFLLSFTPAKDVPDDIQYDDKRYFPVLGYEDCHHEILDRKRLTGEKLAQCREATVKLLQEEKDWGGGALCHMPIHGIRLYRGENLIFQTSICWKCTNYYIQYPDDYGTASWVGLVGKPIKEFLMKEMPIPKAELDRFDAIHGKKNK